MAEKNGASDIIADVAAAAIGWVFLMALLSGAFGLGFGAASFFGGSSHAEAMGLLSALSVIWIYEHRLSQERWDKLRSIIEADRSGD
jgi:hypothetical protein